MAPRFAHFQERSITLRIDRPGGPGIDLGTVEYSITFGGAKDDVGAVILARSKGFDALTALLRKLPMATADIETAIPCPGSPTVSGTGHTTKAQGFPR